MAHDPSEVILIHGMVNAFSTPLKLGLQDQSGAMVHCRLQPFSVGPVFERFTCQRRIPWCTCQLDPIQITTSPVVEKIPFDSPKYTIPQYRILRTIHEFFLTTCQTPGRNEYGKVGKTGGVWILVEHDIHPQSTGRIDHRQGALTGSPHGLTDHLM